jgi:hypothetical protein
MAYSIRLPDGTLVEGIPDEVTPEQAKARILASRPELAPTPKAAPFSLRDVALSLGQGAVGGVKALTDVFGAGNVASEALERGQRALGEAMTPERQAELQRRAQMAKAAEEQGVGAEVSTALGGVAEAPLQSAAQAVGSFLPFVLAAPIGAAAKLLPATMRAINTAIGTAQGVGAVKGSIYDSVKERLVSEGMPEQLAEQQAQAAQAYTGKNIEQIGLGGALGAVAGRFGAESLLSKAGAQQAAPGMLRRAGTAALAEAPTEAAQGGQERMAANIALQREGFNVPTFQGVAGQAAQEAAMGALGGATIGAVRGPEVQPPPAPPAPPTAAAPAPAPTPPTPAAPADPAQLYQQRAALQAQPQTPETRAAIDQLTQQIRQVEAQAVTQARAQQEQQRVDAEKAARSAFTQPGQQMEMREFLPPGGAQLATEVETEPTLREQRAEYRQDRRELREQGQMRLPFRYTGEGEPTSITPPPAPRIYMPDIEAVGVPFKTAKDWFNRNVVNRTKEDVAALVQQDPSLVKGQGSRAKILRALLGPDVPAFKEAPRGAPTPTPVSAKPQPGGDQRGVGVPSAPPVAGPTAAAAPAAPQGPVAPGLAPVAPPAPAGVAGEGQQPPALTPAQVEAKAAEDAKKAVAKRKKKEAPVAPPVAPVVEEPAVAPPVAPVEDTRTAAEVQTAIDSLRNKQRGLLLKNGKVPMPNSKARKAYDELETQVQELIPVYDRKAEEERQRDAAEMQRRLDEQQKKTAAPTRRVEAPTPPAPAKPTPPISEEMREPIGTSTFGMEEGEVEIRRGPQAELFPSSKAETRKRAEAADERERAAAEEPAAEAPAADERQMAFDLQPRAEPTVPAWADERAKEFTGGKAVYAEGDVALVRSTNRFGFITYIAVHKDGRAERVDVRSSTSPLLTAEERARFVEARNRAVDADAAEYATNPDGPFAGATTNVVGSDGISKKYTDYLAEITKSLGIGDVRFFVHNGADLDGETDRYGFHGPYLSGLNTTNESSSTNGSVVSFGPNRNDFIIYLKPGMSETKTLEVIAHELGHAIQQIAYDNAPTQVQFAIRKEYEAWLKENKKPGHTAIDLAHNLRTREQAQDIEASLRARGKAEMTADAMDNVDSYWRSFSEWFADNTARWATTADKPLTITEKFFSQVAQKLRDLLRIVTGRQYLPAKTVKDFLDSMGPGSSKMWFEDTTRTEQAPQKQFSVSYGAQQIIDAMGPIEPERLPWYKAMLKGVMTQPGDPSLGTKFRVMMADSAAAVEQRIQSKFNGAVRDALGNLNPMGVLRQAQDYAKLLPEYFQKGSIEKDPTTGLWKVVEKKDVPPPVEVFAALEKWSKKNGLSFEEGSRTASRILEAMRLKELLKSNKTQGTEFPIHMSEPDIATLEREYNADPDLQEISTLMDKARIAMVDNMVAVGRLSKAEGEAWKAVAHYVPFDRISDEISSFDRIKKLSGKGVAQLGKLPELVGSMERPVGNVFTNYMNTLGWMLRQTTNADATRTTLKALESMQLAKPLGPAPQGKENTVGAYVDGELRYWQVPSRYDVLAFKDLTLPKTGLMKFLGAFSDVLRTTVTSLPPFALKQVADDVQRAIFTSGVRNPGPMIRMALTNFPKIAMAEIRGIKHPIVRELGDLGLTGEYDFQQGRPAESLLKEAGYMKRGRFETLLNRLDGITRASDIAVRKAIYDQTKRETNDELLAQVRAREFINFRRRGASNFAAALTSTIPFFNAYIQGTDVLYRAATGQAAASGLERTAARRLFWSRAAMLTAFSTLYALGKSDDEDYKDMDLRTRDGNWILGDGLKIGVPTELGAIFKVIPERMVEYYKRKGTPEEQEAMEAVRTAVAYIAEQYFGRAMPIPQAAKPLLEAWTNFSFLTMRPLEGIFQKGQLPSERRTATTSELAIAMAGFSRDMVGVQVSPIVIDNVLRGYFGSTAAMVTMATDSLLNPTRVDRPLHKYALLSNYLYDPVGTRQLSEFYEEREKVGQINATLNELAKTDPVRAEAFAVENEDRLMLERSINATLNQLKDTRAYRKYLNSPIGAEQMPKDERERELEEIRKLEAELTGWLREAKTEIRKAGRMAV